MRLLANPVPNDTRVVRERRRGPGATITRCNPGGDRCLVGGFPMGGGGTRGHVPVLDAGVE
jgi:hypothetical protein